jgi:hypothetical protein
MRITYAATQKSRDYLAEGEKLVEIAGRPYRAPVTEIVLASAARTATTYSATLNLKGVSAVIFTVDVTVNSGTTLNQKLLVDVDGSGTWEDYATLGNAFAGVTGKRRIFIGQKFAATITSGMPFFTLYTPAAYTALLYQNHRVVISHGDANPVTYSVQASYFFF